MDIDATQIINFDLEEEEFCEASTHNQQKLVGYLLLHEQKGLQRKQYPVFEGDNIIGRNESCHICIPSTAISKEHACVVVNSGIHLLYDKGSRNKSKREKLFLTPEVRYELKHNDELTFGDVNCTYIICIQESGSETEEEEVSGDKVSADDDYDSDASIDILQPTQPCENAVCRGKATSGEDEITSRKMKADNSPNLCPKTSGDGTVAVMETPEFFRKSSHHHVMDTLVLVESESETVSELPPGTLVLNEMEEQTGVMDTEVTQVYDEAEDEESDSYVDVEAATQAFGFGDKMLDEEATSAACRPHEVGGLSGGLQGHKGTKNLNVPAVETTPAYTMDIQASLNEETDTYRKYKRTTFSVAETDSSINDCRKVQPIVKEDMNTSEMQTMDEKELGLTAEDDEHFDGLFITSTLACDVSDEEMDLDMGCVPESERGNFDAATQAIEESLQEQHEKSSNDEKGACPREQILQPEAATTSAPLNNSVQDAKHMLADDTVAINISTIGASEMTDDKTVPVQCCVEDEESPDYKIKDESGGSACTSDHDQLGDTVISSDSGSFLLNQVTDHVSAENGGITHNKIGDTEIQFLQDRKEIGDCETSSIPLEDASSATFLPQVAWETGETCQHGEQLEETQEFVPESQDDKPSTAIITLPNKSPLKSALVNRTAPKRSPSPSPKKVVFVGSMDSETSTQNDDVKCDASNEVAVASRSGTHAIKGQIKGTNNAEKRKLLSARRRKTHDQDLNGQDKNLVAAGQPVRPTRRSSRKSLKTDVPDEFERQNILEEEAKQKNTTLGNKTSTVQNAACITTTHLAGGGPLKSENCDNMNEVGSNLRRSERSRKAKREYSPSLTKDKEDGIRLTSPSIKNSCEDSSLPSGTRRYGYHKVSGVQSGIGSVLFVIEGNEDPVTDEKKSGARAGETEKFVSESGTNSGLLAQQNFRHFGQGSRSYGLASSEELSARDPEESGTGSVRAVHARVRTIWSKTGKKIIASSSAKKQQPIKKLKNSEDNPEDRRVSTETAKNNINLPKPALDAGDRLSRNTCRRTHHSSRKGKDHNQDTKEGLGTTATTKNFQKEQSKCHTGADGQDLFPEEVVSRKRGRKNKTNESFPISQAADMDKPSEEQSYESARNETVRENLKTGQQHSFTAKRRPKESGPGKSQACTRNDHPAFSGQDALKLQKVTGKGKGHQNKRPAAEESNPSLPTKQSKQVKRHTSQTNPDKRPLSSPLRRTTLSSKPWVLFTGIVDEQGQKIVKNLGGELAKSIQDCTHLVTDKIRRTVKFLGGLARGVLIVTRQWLESCKSTGMFVDASIFMVQDPQMEKQYKFSLIMSIQRANHAPMLQGYKVHVTKSVQPEPLQMKEILLCAGAEYLSAMPNKAEEKTIVISCDEDNGKCSPALKAGVPVMSAEFILTGILRQELDMESFRLFCASSTGSPGQTSSAKRQL